MYRIATLAASLFLIASVSLAQQATFEGLGDLPGGIFDSTVLFDGLSENGLVVVGQSITDGNVGEAFRWENGEMEGLGVLPGGFISEAYSTSAEGSVVVGSVAYEKFGDREAFRWEDGEMVGLGDLPGGDFYSEAYNVSADGSVIIGHSVSENGSEAFRWEAAADTMVGLGDLPGGDFFSIALGVSEDGSVIVGQSNSEEGPEAFRWTEDGGMEGLGDLPGGAFESFAYAVSADGSVIVGYSVSENGPEAFRWQDGEMTALGALPGGPFFASYAIDVSSDGSVIVGMSEAENQAAFVWTEEDGIRRLKEVLEEDYGLDLTGWSLGRASSISDDGTVIAGTTLLGGNPDGNTEAWRVSGLMPVADEATPEALADVLSAPSPNPASGTSTLTIAVERGQHVAVEVFDVMGRHVQTVYEGALAGGMSETLTLDASALPAGIYMIRATGEDFTEARRVTVIR